VATEENGARSHTLQGSDRILQSGTIAFTIVRSRRAVRTILTKRQIAAQHKKARCGKICGKGKQ
jgi:hypothetical protein